MSEYLTKEEIKLWRSSLEKITLEEYAQKLGKKIESSKPTNDLIDIVFKGKPVVSSDSDYKTSQAERLSTIAERAFEREQQIAPTPFSIHHAIKDEIKEENITQTKPEKTTKTAKAVKPKKSETVKKTSAAKKSRAVKAKPVVETKKEVKDLREEVRIIFKKALTDREQKVFDHFAQNKGKIVYAKDLAELLELPKDYVYKYIKKLRAKIEGERLENADKGGFILNI